MGIVEKLITGSLGTSGLTGIFDPEARESCPNLWELLTLVELSNGQHRVPSTLKVALGRCEWMVSVNDEDTRQTLLVASPSLSGVFARVESQLTSSEAIWRQWPPKPGQGKRK